MTCSDLQALLLAKADEILAESFLNIARLLFAGLLETSIHPQESLDSSPIAVDLRFRLGSEFLGGLLPGSNALIDCAPSE